MDVFHYKGVTIYRGIILPIQYTRKLNEDTSISLYHSSPVFYTRISCLANRTHGKNRLCTFLLCHSGPVFYTRRLVPLKHTPKIDCAISSLPAFTFPGIILHSRLQLRFQLNDKHKDEKSDL